MHPRIPMFLCVDWPQLGNIKKWRGSKARSVHEGISARAGPCRNCNRFEHCLSGSTTASTLRRRQLCNNIRQATQVIVAQSLRRLVHRIGNAHALAKHQKLHSDIKRLLRAKRRHAGILRLAVVAVTGKARRKTLLYRLGDRGKRRKASNEECHGRLEHGKLSESRLNRAEGGAPP